MTDISRLPTDESMKKLSNKAAMTSASLAVAKFILSLKGEDIVFLDCGANDGCSAIKYLAEHPCAKVLSFEPNPNLHTFHWGIPNKLAKSAVGTESNLIELLIDSVDGDGSTTVKSKQVDFTQQVANEDCPRIKVECVNLGEVITMIAKAGALIDLKLDIEGAEYEIINSLLDSGAALNIRNFYCEFHWDRIGLKKWEHDEIVCKLNASLDSAVKDWDAVDWMMANLNGKAKTAMRNKRRRALYAIYCQRLLKSIRGFQ